MLTLAFQTRFGGRDPASGQPLGALLVAGLLVFTACVEGGERPLPPASTPDVAQRPEVGGSPQDAWWSRMMEHCGSAYEGRLIRAPEGDEMLRGDELLLVHFRECSERELRLPFHIERGPEDWDRSRTWIFARTDEGLHLDHDHRRPDGSADEVTHYGGHTADAGSASRQVFLFTDWEGYRPEGPHRGWRVEIEPHSRYTYGTFRGDDLRFRIDFDLSQPVAPPPAPWGH